MVSEVVSGSRPAGGVLRRPLFRVVARRLAMAVPLLFVVSALSFVLVSLTPGDAAREILGSQAPPEVYPKLRHQLGLDQPLYEQYWTWLKSVPTGDLGSSLYSDEPVTTTLRQRLPVTMFLVGGALLVSAIVGIALGVVSAVRGGALGRAVDALALIGFALPAFWVAAMLILLFAVELRWLPATGYVPIGQSPWDWLRSLTLPVMALAIGGVAAIAKQTREAMLDVLASEHIRMAWANGLGARSIIYRHALKNAALPIITMIGLLAVNLVGGTVLIETVFGLPGLGSLAVASTTRHDLPVVQGVAIYFTVLVVLVNLVVDLAYGALNPKVELR